jgi:hypothetical protein
MLSKRYKFQLFEDQLDNLRREPVPVVVIFVISLATEPQGRPQARTAVIMPFALLTSEAHERLVTEDTSDLAPEHYYYEVRLDTPAGTQSRIKAGFFELRPALLVS